MAFGIDDALMAAAAGLNLGDTLAQTVKKYRKTGHSSDIELLIEEVRITVLQRLDEADLALSQFERMLAEKDINLNQRLQEVIASTPWWRPHESHRLKRIQRSFNALADATYAATDDVAALLRCREKTGEMGAAVVESAKTKHDLHARLLRADSVKSAISILRTEMTRHKAALNQ